MSESVIPNGNDNLRRVIEELKKLPKTLGEKISSGVSERLGAVRGQLNRENVVNTMLPKPFAIATNKIMDKFGSKSRPDTNPNESSEYKLKPDSEEETELEVDALEALADHISEGFDETNENLSAILTALDAEEPTVQLLDMHGEAIHSIESESKETNLELISVNGTILKELKQITKNTTQDTLSQKEKEWESRSKSSSSSSSEALNSVSKNSDKSSSVFGDVFKAMLAEKALEKGLSKLKPFLKGAGSVIAGGFGAKSLYNKWKLNKAVTPGTIPPATPGAPTATASKLMPNLFTEGADDAAKAAASATKGGAEGAAKAAGSVGLKGLAKGAAKFVPGLGTALTLGIGAYEAADVMGDDTKTDQEKNVAVTKIGSATGGVIAGAAAGAALGAVGGPVGVLIGGALGGIVGGVAGDGVGDVIGEMLFGKPADKAIPKESVETAGAIAGVPLKNELQSVEASQTKSFKLQSLTQQIEQTNAEKETMKNETQIVPVPINNSGSKTPQTNQAQNKTQIPGVRNNDGTIQRLLDANYAPLMN